MTVATEAVLDVATVAASHAEEAWVLVDCRFSLADPGAGARSWAQGTIPGAVYAHLDADLSGPVVPGRTGRHPLPSVQACAAVFGGWGIGKQTRVVVFDDFGGAFASRLWWMLRWLGHDAVAVLDGGLPAWVESGHALAPGAPSSRRARFAPHPRAEMHVSAAQVLDAADDSSVEILDARGPKRFSGEHEPTDPVAGHISGAINAPFVDNLTPNKRFRSPSELRERYRDLVAAGEPGDAICYCGSGVTACHNIVAMVHAGFAPARLYSGSWSEWIADPLRPRQ